MAVLPMRGAALQTLCVDGSRGCTCLDAWDAHVARAGRRKKALAVRPRRCVPRRVWGRNCTGLEKWRHEGVSQI